jgi:adenosylcobinamide-GDP ribazoletransferase
LPLVGVFLGAGWWAAGAALVFSGIHIVLAAAILAVTPFILTGFLHLDGYMDTSDAVLSRRPVEDKLRILKDPHAGAFSVVMLGVLFVLQLAAVFVVIDHEKNLALLAVIPVTSRCCAAAALCGLKVMPQSRYAKMFMQKVRAPHRIFVIVVTISVAALAYLFAGTRGMAVFLVTILGFACPAVYSYRGLGGFSGDLAGFSLVISELCGLIALAIL